MTETITSVFDYFLEVVHAPVLGPETFDDPRDGFIDGLCRAAVSHQERHDASLEPGFALMVEHSVYPKKWPREQNARVAPGFIYGR
jgi:hypothetical protein